MMTDLDRVHRRMHRVRHRYLQVETVLEFFGHAVRSRTTTRLAEMLQACDHLAAKSMDLVLRPLRIDTPPALVYLDRGLGASILRAGLRLWDGGSVSPAAAIKITRFNLYRPTSMLHEAGHQVAHLTGWNAELATALRHGIPDAQVAGAWEGWATELGPDLIAFAHAGYGAVAALYDVISGDPGQVFSYMPGDPHPVAYLRVLVGVQMCVRFYGVGPWDTLAQAWRLSYPLSSAPPGLRHLIEGSLEQLPRIVEIGLRTPMRSFGNLPLASLVDPANVSPAALLQLRQDAGAALTTSSHWLLAEGLRLLALTAYQVAIEPDRAEATAREYESWMRALGALAGREQRPAA
jgi:hypothetical protein